MQCAIMFGMLLKVNFLYQATSQAQPDINLIINIIIFDNRTR